MFDREYGDYVNIIEIILVKIEKINLIRQIDNYTCINIVNQLSYVQKPIRENILMSFSKVMKIFVSS